jgi:hypothetical protein
VSIKGALRKLEEAAGVGCRCLRCRVHYIRFGDEIRRTHPADLFVSTCADCGQTLKLIHSGYTPRERVVLVSIISDSTTQGDAAKWVAAYAWTRHLPRFSEMKEVGRAAEKRLRDAVADPEARRRVKVLDEYAAHKARVTAAAEETPEVPPDWHKVIDALDVLRNSRNARPLMKDDKVFSYSVMAEMEVFMWGAKSEETLNLIEDRRAELMEQARATAERLEREKVEREERYRREAEECERQRQERLREMPQGTAARAASPIGTLGRDAQAAPVSRFRTSNAPVPHNPMVFDPTAAHVPEPARMVSFPDPADPFKQMIVGRDIGPDTYDPNHPDPVGFMRSSPPKAPDSPARRYYRGSDYDGDPRY